MAKLKWPLEEFNVVDLTLDVDNLRLDIGNDTSQDAIISDLFINQDAYEVAESLARNKVFPHELPIVAKEKGKLVVLEGNRRIAALKALINPALVPSHSSRLNHLLKTYPDLPITKIEVRLAKSRKEALPVIGAIHTTASRKPWATLRQAYFYYAQIESKQKRVEELIVEYPDVDIKKFVRMWEMHHLARSIPFEDSDLIQYVADQQRFPITTFERLYSSDEFQNKFGLEMQDNGTVIVRSNKESLLSCLKPVINDIKEKRFTSRTHNKNPQIKKYVENLEAPEIPENSRAKRVTTFKSRDRAKRTRSKVTKLVPKDLSCELKSPALRRTLDELQRINYNSFPNATHDLLRSFLECSLKAYFKEKGETVKKTGHYTQLKDVLRQAEAYFKKTNNKECLQIVQTIMSNDGRTYLLSQDFFNALNHNPSIFSTGNHVKEAWESMENLIRHLLSNAD